MNGWPKEWSPRELPWRQRPEGRVRRDRWRETWLEVSRSQLTPRNLDLIFWGNWKMLNEGMEWFALERFTQAACPKCLEGAGTLKAATSGHEKGWMNINKIWLLNIAVPYDPAIPLWGIYTQKLNTGAPTFVHQCSLHYSQQPKGETTHVSINRLMDAQNVVYAYNGGLSSLKKEWSATWMNLVNIMLSDRNRTPKATDLLWGHH